MAACTAAPHAPSVAWRRYNERFSQTAALLLALNPDWYALKEWKPRAAVGRHLAADGVKVEEDTEAGVDVAAGKLREFAEGNHMEVGADEVMERLELEGAFRRYEHLQKKDKFYKDKHMRALKVRSLLRSGGRSGGGWCHCSTFVPRRRGAT